MTQEKSIHSKYLTYASKSKTTNDINLYRKIVAPCDPTYLSSIQLANIFESN